MKNFKKVISAVVALAMSISSFAAVSASNFTDVADTAAYAEAVDVLSALGIVNGYEDGSFKPEGEITRAEAATMIVGALNMTEDAKAAAGTSQFDDVNTSAAWASGYINVGVAQGFINGMDATTFAPQENVTYAQMCVMLTSIAGFGEYAAANTANSTDWSYGYTSMAAAVGINKGVSVSKDTALTRGQVAMMIYNTLTTPKLGVAEYSLTGNTYSQLDGRNGRDFVTLLSEKFNGYVVTAKITATPVSSALDNDKVTIDVQKADWWDDQIITAAHGAETIYFKGVDVNSNLLQVGKSVIVYDDLDDPYMVYFSATSKTETREFAAEDYVLQSKLGAASRYADGSAATDDKIRFGSKYYTMANSVALYVNGSLIATLTDNLATDNTTLDTYLGDAQGTIKLVKTANATGYDAIFVTAYEIAKVENVTYKNNQTVVNFTTKTNLFNGTARKLTINDDEIEDGDKIVTVKNGDAEIALKDIVKGDIIAIACDFTAINGGEVTADILEVLVSRETVNGKIGGMDNDEETYTVDGKEYGVVNFSAVSMNLGDTYTLSLDPFGRIFEEEMDASSVSYAILERELENGEKIQLVLADGTAKSYELESGASIKNESGTATSIGAIINGGGVNRVAPWFRVVEYTVKNSTGNISEIKALNDVSRNVPAANTEYKGTTGKLGTNTIAAGTNVINAVDYVKKATAAGNYNVSTVKATDYATFSTDSFKDGSKYTAISFKATGSVFANFVIITKVDNVYTAESRFAIYKKAAQQTTTADGDRAWVAKVLYEGEEQDLYFEYQPTGLAVGDAFYFEKGADGLVEGWGIVFDMPSVVNTTNVAAAVKDFTSVTANMAFQNGAATTNSTYFSGKYDATRPDGWIFTPAQNTHDIELFYAVITDVKSNSVELARVNSANQINRNNAFAAANGVDTFGIASDAHIYINDINDTSVVNASDKLYAGSFINSRLSQFETAQNSEVYYANTTAIIAADTATLASGSTSLTGLAEYKKMTDADVIDANTTTPGTYVQIGTTGYAALAGTPTVPVVNSIENPEAALSYALVMVVDGDIVCAYEILQ